MNTNINDLYAKRDHMAMDQSGGYYTRHLNALTSEALYSKFAIAGELAWRDMEIDRLKALLAEKTDQVKTLSVTLDSKMAAWLLEMFTKDNASEVNLVTGNGYGGMGVYAYYGNNVVFLGSSDTNTMPSTLPFDYCAKSSTKEHSSEWYANIDLEDE